MAETITIPQSQGGDEEGSGLLLGVVGVAAAIIGAGALIAMGSKKETDAGSLADEPPVDYTVPSVGQVYETNEECYEVEVQTLNGIAGVMQPGDGIGEVVLVSI